MLNEWSDREPDPTPKHRGFAIVFVAIMAVGTITFIVQSIASILGK